jgi:colicin import membrane protein
MSQATIETSTSSTTEAQEPFYYGWRYVRQRYPNGREVVEQVPLTREDVLYPQEEDFVTHTDDHERFCIYLYNVLCGLFLSHPTTVVLHDVLVDWNVPGMRPLGPDIAVIFDVRERHNWSTFDVVEEGTGPALIIEVASPKTRDIDLLDKVQLYDQADVPYYFIVDSLERKGVLTRRLLGYQLRPDGYAALIPNERGWLWMEPVGLWLGIREQEVECYDRQGKKIEDHVGVLIAYAAEQQARADAEARANAEQQARADAEARIAELEAELRRLRGDA